MKAKILFFFLIISSLAIAAHMDRTNRSGRPAFTPSLASFSPVQASVFSEAGIDYIQVDHAESADQLVLYNVIGQAIRYYKVEGDQRYMISDLPSGVYLASFLDHRSEVIRTVRIQKQA